MAGVNTTNLITATLLDSVLGNRAGTTVKAPVADLAAQLAASGALADRLNNLDAAMAGRPFVIFVAGQSNAARRVTYGPFSPPPNLYMWSYAGTALSAAAATTTIGTFQTGAAIAGTSNWGMMIGARAAIEYPTRPVFVINISRGGIPIAQWDAAAADPNMWTATLANVPAALAEIAALTGQTVDRIDAAFWWQGEADASNAAGYPALLDALITRFRDLSWFGRTAPVICSGLSPYWSTNLESIMDLAIRMAVSMDAGRRRFVDTNLLPQSFWDPTDSYIHMTGAGYWEASDLAWDAYANGGGSAAVGENWQYDGENTGGFVFGRSLPLAGYFGAFVKDWAGASLLAIVNNSTDGAARARLQARVGAKSVNLECDPGSGGRLVSSDDYWGLIAAGLTLAVFQAPAADNQTSATLLTKIGGVTVTKKVKIGAADSGGTGYRMLRIDN
ncbi:sialate O-acetylesterase [Rhodobacter capsulatus]|uniref:sialate O-acetylesterase n=1 Tax=Rhodobacter capsulatus TaxID=1061 RepID=UPI0011433BE3|nr:sialate O-acetylesterase [Rhodobacter capsulatus]TQD37482.1 sialate O-acetylesterase [Rhodobacter capsulatus]